MAVVDTGASASAMSTLLAKDLGLLGRVDPSQMMVVGGVGAKSTEGTLYMAKATVGGHEMVFKCMVVDTLSFDLLVGLDVLSNYRC
jgi:hypothetical protein